MKWIKHHRKAEALVDMAERITREGGGSAQEVRQLYWRSAEHEEKAFAAVEAGLTRTRGILAVSVVALLFKADMSKKAVEMALNLKNDMDPLPAFAVKQLDDLIDAATEKLKKIK